MGPISDSSGAVTLRSVISGADAFHEDDAILRAKVDAAFRSNLTPILCVGEHERLAAEHAADVCIRQLQAVLGDEPGTGHARRIVVAYEPEWAIGAVRPAPLGHISGVSLVLKQWLDAQVDLEGSQLIYGGSGPGLLTQLGHAVDGLFLGRFAHEPGALRDIADEGALLAAG